MNNQDQCLCHMDGCKIVADIQLIIKSSTDYLIVPMCREHAESVFDNRQDYEMYDDSSITVDLPNSMTTTTTVKKFRKI